MSLIDHEPRTVCTACIHMSGINAQLCAATITKPPKWSTVTGELEGTGYGKCGKINTDGECPKYEAKPLKDPSAP